MRRWLFIKALFVIAIVACAPAMAASCLRYDSCWWSGLRVDQKLAVVEGMISAVRYTYPTAQREDAQIFKLGLQNPRILHFYKTPDEYVKLIDKFYSSKAKSDFVIGAVLACLADNPPKGCTDLSE